MGLLKKLFRPVYKLFIEKPLWWFLDKVKAFFLAEIGVQIAETAHRLAVMEQRQAAADAGRGAQWNALEQLLLAMFRQPDASVRSASPQNELAADAAGRDRTNERNNLR